MGLSRQSLLNERQTNMSLHPSDPETMSDLFNPQMTVLNGSLERSPLTVRHCGKHLTVDQPSTWCQLSGLARGRRHLSESHPAGPASLSSPWS